MTSLFQALPLASLFQVLPPEIPLKIQLRNHFPWQPTRPNPCLLLQFLPFYRRSKFGFPLSLPKCSLRHTTDFVQEERVVYPRPSEIPWQKELANSVNLIGVVGTPLQIKHLDSGKVLAWTRLGVKKSASETLWIGLTFWNELAHVAFQHVEKGQKIFVSGRLVSDIVNGDDDKSQTYFKVVVNQLNFIEKSSSTLYESNFMNSGEKHGMSSGGHSGSTEELWQAFFANPVDWWDNRRNKGANPVDWWDNRRNKRNPKYPDFKHKHTGEALWIEGRNNPSWVKSQLVILDSKMQSLEDNESNMPFSLSSISNFMTQ